MPPDEAPWKSHGVLEAMTPEEAPPPNKTFETMKTEDAPPRFRERKGSGSSRFSRIGSEDSSYHSNVSRVASAPSSNHQLRRLSLIVTSTPASCETSERRAHSRWFAWAQKRFTQHSMRTQMLLAFFFSLFFIICSFVAVWAASGVAV